ncbi:MAG: carboxymuconolactone decarboxylase family protein [Pseudomonadota bacterium]|nr:carboxymuconolactone decarboxylase family protein [Pseudomonadota bacterium]
MALVEPLPLGASEEVEELANFFNTTLGFPPNSVLTMQRRPEIAAAFIGLNRAVMTNAGRVTSEQKRLLALICSLTAGCRYCQAHTALAAERFGATEQRLAAIWEYEQSDLFTQAEKAAFDLALAASTLPNAVNEALAARVRAHWTEDEIVEIVGVIALFGFLNRWNDSMGTALEPGATEAARTHLGPRGWDAGKHGRQPDEGAQAEGDAPAAGR